MSRPPITNQPIGNSPPPYGDRGYSNAAYNTNYSSGQSGIPIQMQPVAGTFQLTQTSGLDILANLQKIHVHQEVHLVEVFTSFERKNRYRVCNDEEQQILYAREESSCCARHCCGVLRPMTMTISMVTTSGEQPLIFLDRPFNCKGCCCPCSLQVMEVQYPIGETAATIKEIWTCCLPKYEIFDKNGSLLFRIAADDCCVCKCCADVHFRIFKGDQEIADIEKHWGSCREVCGKANDFSIIFHDKSETSVNKAILLGATFLIDFNYFEQE